jgi:hypothetical protein
MKRFFREFIVMLCVLIVAAAIIIPVTLYVIHQNSTDTFKGNIGKIPIDISSPSYGIILSMPVTEGSTIIKGQKLATVHILDPTFKLQGTNDIYSMQDKILTIRSPRDGILGKIALANQSTINEDQTLMQLYTLDNITVQIFFTRENKITDYGTVYVGDPSNGNKYPLQLLGQIPVDAIPLDTIPLDTNTNVPLVLTSVYRATCVHATDCNKIIYSKSVTIYAQKKQLQLFGLNFNIP